MNNQYYNFWLPYSQMKIAKPPIIIKKAKKCQIFTEDNKILIDAIASWWSVAHGYQNKHIVKNINKQLKTISHIIFSRFMHKSHIELSKKILSITSKKNLNKIFFADSGSIAVEIAMKIAIQYYINKYKINNKNNEKYKFISFCDSYHGDTLEAMSLSNLDSSMHRKFKKYLAKRNLNIKLPKNKSELKEFDEFLHKNKDIIAGVIIEPLLQAAGGMKFHNQDILYQIYKITKQYDILFIVDECATGFFRTGKYFAIDHVEDLKPDILLLGKALTGGFLSLAMTITSDEIYDQFLSDDLNEALMHGPTFMGNLLATSAANASLDLFAKIDYESKVKNISYIMLKELNKCKNLNRVKDIRVMGAVGVIELNITLEEIFFIREEFINKYNIFIRPFANVIYLMPPLIISEKELLQITDSIYQVIKNLK